MDSLAIVFLNKEVYVLVMYTYPLCMCVCLRVCDIVCACVCDTVFLYGCVSPGIYVSE